MTLLPRQEPHTFDGQALAALAGKAAGWAGQIQPWYHMRDSQDE